MRIYTADEYTGQEPGELAIILSTTELVILRKAAEYGMGAMVDYEENGYNFNDEVKSVNRGLGIDPVL